MLLHLDKCLMILSAASAMHAADSLDGFFATNNTAEARPPLSVVVSILPNAEIIVGENNIAAQENMEGKSAMGSKEKLAKALEVAEDFDVWIELLRRQAD